MLPGWTRDALLEEVIVAPRRGFVAIPGLQVIERPGWLQLVTPSFRNGGLNEVAHAALDTHEADAVIDATLACYRELGVRFRWSVTHDSAPDDLAERLARRGLVRSEVIGMARVIRDEASAADDDASTASTSAASATSAASSVLRVLRVDASTCATYSRVMAEGWSIDADVLDAYHRACLAEPSGRHRFFLAVRGDAPVGTAGYIAFERSAYLLGAVVLPAFRGAGAYRALVHARLRDAAARGLTLATSQARAETSAPILERLGFVTVCRFPSFWSI